MQLPHLPPSSHASSSTSSASLHYSQVVFFQLLLHFLTDTDKQSPEEGRELGTSGAEGQSLHLVGYTVPPRGSIPLPHGKSTKALLEWGYPALLSLPRVAEVHMAKAEVSASPCNQDHMLFG